MARGDELDIVPSILDRLLDDNPDVSTEPSDKRFQKVRDLKQSVARDLQALLNTRRETLDDLPPEFVELNRALVVYGLPDFTSLNILSDRDRKRMRRAMEQAILAFEPRLKQVKVVMEEQLRNDRAQRFRVEAILQVTPASEPVSFDAELRLNTLEYVVQG